MDKALFTLIDKVQITEDSQELVANSDLDQVVRDASLDNEAMSQALETIRDAYVTRGLFSDRRPAALQFPLTKDNFRVVLSSVVCRLILSALRSSSLIASRRL